MESNKDIAAHRKRIDLIDNELIRLLRERLDAARAIGRIKRENNLPVVDPGRESILNARLSSLTDNDLLTQTFIKRLWQQIIEESYRVQTEEST
jgi:chorismate mutase